MRLASIILILSASLAWGQVEVSAFGGLAALSQHVDNRPIFGAAVGVNLGQRVQLFGEYTRLPLPDYPIVYDPLTGTALTYGTAFLRTASQRYDNVGGGLQIRFLAHRKIRPYLVVPAVGLAHMTVSADPAFSTSRNDVYLAVGAGARLFGGKKWGFRPEYRYMAFLNAGNFWAGTVSGHVLTGSLFYQFRN